MEELGLRLEPEALWEWGCEGVRGVHVSMLVSVLSKLAFGFYVLIQILVRGTVMGGEEDGSSSLATLSRAILKAILGEVCSVILGSDMPASLT